MPLKKRPITKANTHAVYKMLAQFDNRHNVAKKARSFVPFRYRRKYNYDFFDRDRVRYDGARVTTDYYPTHLILRHISNGQIKGKRILHIGGATGVYAHFLNEIERANAEVIDLNKKLLNEAKKRNVPTTHFNVVPAELKGQNIMLPKGIWKPRYETRLPYQDKEFSFVISEHFLFSDFHRKIGGFENIKGDSTQSINTLRELNRILKMGGRVIITRGHSVNELKGAKKGTRVGAGFVVEEIYDDILGFRLDDGSKAKAPAYFVLKKVKEIRRQRQFIGESKGSPADFNRK